MADFVLIGIFCVGCLFGVVHRIWRTNLAMNHPEKFRRLREMEEDQKKARVDAARMYGGAAKGVAAPVAKIGAGILLKLITKR